MTISMSKPIWTGSSHQLAFDKLSPREFERLCLWLVVREGFERAAHFGAAGSDEGQDVVAYSNGDRWVFQAKNVRKFGPKDARRELEKVLALQSLPACIVFVVACDVAQKARNQAQALCSGRLRCEFWASTELDERVKRHSDILREFFHLPLNADRDSPWDRTNHWPEAEEPLRAADGLALLEYCADLRRKLLELEGDFAMFRLSDSAIPLAIEDAAAEVRGPRGPREPPSAQGPRWQRRSGDARVLADFVKQGGIWFLLGEPGGGKTTSLRSEALACVEALKHLHPDEVVASTANALIPVYVKLPEWLAWSRNTATLFDVLQFAVREAQGARDNYIAHVLFKLRPRVVLLLDGWDEINPQHATYLEAATRLVKALVGAPAARVHAAAIACRSGARPVPPLGLEPA